MIKQAKTDARATNAVCRNLQKDHPEKSLWIVGDTLPRDSLESFTKAAKGWLRDRSELAASTLEKADWADVYGYFFMMNERKPKEKTQEAPQEAPESTEKPAEAKEVPQPRSLIERLLDGKSVPYRAIRETVGGITVLKFEIGGKIFNVSETVEKYLEGKK